MISDKLLEIKDLKTYFYTADGELRAVDGLSYSVNKGECVALVGESACGKSVSALSILRLIPYPPGIIIGGQIIFEGKDLLQLTQSEMRHIRGNRIGFVFQEPTTSLNPVLSIRRQLTEALELHRGLDTEASAAEAMKLLNHVGIPDAERRLHDYPHQFSGGMQQRIMIAMALSCNPALIIADEPTTSLDATVQEQLLELLDNLRKEFGMAVIIITHNLGIVARFADKVEVMYAGRLVEGGPTEEIYSQAAHPYTFGLLASVPRLDLPKTRELHTIEGLPPNLAQLPRNVCAFSERCKYAIDICTKKRPELEEISPGHVVACLRHSEIKQLVEAGK